MKSKVIVALDYPQASDAFALAEQLGFANCEFKIGKELFTHAGPDVVRAFVARGAKVFLDLKYHDIPSTVAAACRAAAALGVWMVNVHASGGRDMLCAARASLTDCQPRPLLIAVTVLTSLDDAQLREIGVGDSAATQVARLTRLAHDCELDGVVCSPHEIAAVKRDCGAAFLTITPGIRPSGVGLDDQHRAATPTFAVRAGGDYLVIGRPITRAADPPRALAELELEIARAAREV